MKKLSGEAGAAIICIVWEIFFYVACLTNNPFSWLVFVFATVTEIIIVYFDNKREQAQKEAKRNRDLFSKQTENYLATIYEYGREGKPHDKRRS